MLYKVILGSFNCNLTSPFGIILHVASTFSWSLVTLCGVEALYDMGLDEDARDFKWSRL